MDYQKKYLKYKNKYLELKKQLGSGPQLDKISSDKNIGMLLNVIVFQITQSQRNVKNNIETLFQKINSFYLDNILNQELDELVEIKFERITTPYNSNWDNLNKLYYIFNKINEKKMELVILQPGLIKLVNKIGINYVPFRECTVHEFMTLDGVENFCSNRELVRGSCAEPSFLDELYGVYSLYNGDIIELLNLIQNRLPQGQTITIVVGARENSEFEYVSGDIQLFFGDRGQKFDEIIEEIRNKPLRTQYKINAYFPTNIKGSNIDVLNRILELTQNYRINFINKMCGSCFRSMYYLVQNARQNFTYQVEPVQRLNDSTEILKCFKK